MASRVVFVFIVVCVNSQNSLTALVNVQFTKEIVGQIGQPSLLKCVVQTPAEGVYIKGVSWRKDGEDDPLFYWRNGAKIDQKPGFELADPNFNRANMNMSLLITNTTVANAGRYQCFVSTNRGGNQCSFDLTVTAKYSTPTIRSISERSTGNRVAALVCDSHGGYPKGKIQWMAEYDIDWIKGAETVAEPDQRGLFNLSSKLTVQPGSGRYTCVVLNASGGKEAVATFPAGDGSALGRKGDKGLETHKIVAPVVVIGSLTVGLLMVVVLLRWRARRKARRQSTAPIMGDAHNSRDDGPDVEEEEEKGLTDPNKTDIRDHV